MKTKLNPHSGVLIIVQVRLDSHRLPAKAMLWTPTAPVFVLAALRAGRNGMPVVIGTTDDHHGDLVGNVARLWGLSVYQGPKDDVLSRFLGAASGLPSDALIVRLTGDNILPDASLINTCLSELKSRGVGYLTTNVPSVPYGLSVEVFEKSLLVAADRCELSSQDREHVTPWIIRNCSTDLSAFVPPGVDEVWKDARVTIDTFEDYVSWLNVLVRRTKIVDAPWPELLAVFHEHLTEKPYA